MAENLQDTPFIARYWHLGDDGRLVCDLCPRQCQLQEGQRAACFVRQRQGDQMVLTTYGRSSGFCIDPVEKKPLFHFLPGSPILSFGTAGCNLTCRFCQNWDISRAHDMDRLMDQADPQQIARIAQDTGCASVAFTYNDPVIFAEYAIESAQACHARGVRSVAVTAGYIQGQGREDFFAHMDAANVDLKAFSDAFYHQYCGSHLAPVLDTLLWIRHHTTCWLELTTLLIPGLNDSAEEIAALSGWVARELGTDVPLHFTAFHPAWRMNERPATPAATLQQARYIAHSEGLQHVYVGNVHDTAGATTACTRCHAPLIVRDGYALTAYHLTADGHCPHCDEPLAGRFAPHAGGFGNRRIPLRLGDATGGAA